MKTLQLTQPDDWHLHLRDGSALQTTVTDAARLFGRAIVMPNLKPPVCSAQQALDYRQRILEARPAGSDFEPLMTLYLTDSLRPEEIVRARDSGHVHAAKLYPAGATTNSENGVTDISCVYPVLEAMIEAGMPLLIHGEVTTPGVDIFDREKVFIDRVLAPLLERYPELRVVLEHITTGHAVDFVMSREQNLGATITAHHLLYNRNDMLAGAIRPHLYCLPILKRDSHQEALISAATAGDPRFFLGTDSAPHQQKHKEASCGCAGAYTAHAALELYAEVFDQAGALDRLEAFASFHGADFYGLPRNRKKLVLERSSWRVPEQYALEDGSLIPLRAGELVNWRLTEVQNSGAAHEST